MSCAWVVNGKRSLVVWERRAQCITVFKSGGKLVSFSVFCLDFYLELKSRLRLWRAGILRYGDLSWTLFGLGVQDEDCWGHCFGMANNGFCLDFYLDFGRLKRHPCHCEALRTKWGNSRSNLRSMFVEYSRDCFVAAFLAMTEGKGCQFTKVKLFGTENQD